MHCSPLNLHAVQISWDLHRARPSDKATLIVFLLFLPPSPRLLSVYLALDVWKLQNSVWKQDQVGGQESVLRVGGPGAPVSNPPCLGVREGGAAKSSCLSDLLAI